MGRAAQWLLAAALAPLFIAFAWQATLPTVGDDSVSYLAIARWLAGSAGPHLAPWLPWHAHFPPLFPMLLAATGGAGNFLVAHVVVAVLAAACVPLIARHAALRLESEWGGFWVAAAFVALPTAWLGAKAILSEPLFLSLTLAALIAHERRIERGSGDARSFVFFGVLVALACSTRAMGLALAAAFVIHEGLRARPIRLRSRAWLALAPLAVVTAAWLAVRPGGHMYAHTLATVIQSWTAQPLATLQDAAGLVGGGWLASFVAEGDTPVPVRAALYAAGVAAVAGSVRAAVRNRIDGWYVLLTLAVLLAWGFGIDVMRRLFYPVVPLLLLHAAEMVFAAAARLRIPSARLAAAAVCAIPFAVSAPATLDVARKALDCDAVIPGMPYRYCDLSDYYRFTNAGLARTLAAKHAATLAGLEALRSRTPPGSRVMWVRPEYVAILADREAVAWYYDWDARTLAARVLEGRVDFIVVSGMAKSDLAVRVGDVAAPLRNAAPYSRPVFGVADPAAGKDEFVLLAVDRDALQRYAGASR